MANHIRPKITPSLAADGTICVTVEWLDIAEGEQIRRVLFTEGFEFEQKAQAAGTGYVSRVACAEAQVRDLTFAEEALGRRDYVLDAETGHLGLEGQAIG